MTKIKFFIYINILLLCLGAEIVFLLFRPKHDKILKDFVKISTLTSPAFFINTPYLRHRDLNNVNAIFAYNPALRESKIGTFSQSVPLK